MPLPNVHRAQPRPLPDQQIACILQEHFGLAIDALTELLLGADKDAFLYKAQTRDSSYFIKLKQNHNHGVLVQTFLQKNHIPLLIFPIKTLKGEVTYKMADLFLTVYPFIAGQDGFHRELTNDQWIALGRAVRQIHSLKIPPSLKKGLRLETFSPKWQVQVRSFLKDLKNKKSGHLIGQEFINFMSENVRLLHKLVGQAEHLFQKLHGQSYPLVLCHCDLHGGNILIDQEQIFLVDWDNTKIAPKERDLMFIGGGVGNVWNKPHEAKAFFQGYQEHQLNQELLTYYRQDRILEDIAFYSVQFLKSADTDEQRQSFTNFIAQFAADGVVDIALRD